MHRYVSVCVCVCFTYRSLRGRQASLPADVNESRCDDDHADGADDHQNHKQLAVVAACLTGSRLAATGCAVVLDAGLMKQTHTITITRIKSNNVYNNYTIKEVY